MTNFSSFISSCSIYNKSDNREKNRRKKYTNLVTGCCFWFASNRPPLTIVLRCNITFTLVFFYCVCVFPPSGTKPAFAVPLVAQPGRLALFRVQVPQRDGVPRSVGGLHLVWVPPVRPEEQNPVEGGLDVCDAVVAALGENSAKNYWFLVRRFASWVNSDAIRYSPQETATLLHVPVEI